MPALKNARHEAFACAIVKGMTAAAAYVAAGYKADDGNAIRLTGNDKVAARIAELKGEAAGDAVMTAKEVLEGLSVLARSNMQDYVGALGQVLDVGQLTREHAAAVHELTIDTYMEGHGDDAEPVKRVKLKLYDKRAALVDLGRHHGLFKDKLEHTGKDGNPIETKDVTPRSDLDAARRIAWLLNAAASAPPPEKDKPDG